MKADFFHSDSLPKSSTWGLVACPSRRGPRDAAFSTPELLVVLVVVAVLAVVLFGVLQSVSTSSRSAKCISQLRQLAVGMRLWRNDHQDRFAPRLGVAAIRPSQYFYEGGYILHPEDWLCPSATTEQQGAWLHHTYAPSPKYRVVFGGKRSSYTVNGLAFYPANLPGMGISYTQSFQIFQGVESKVPLFLDGYTRSGVNAMWQLNGQGWSSNRTSKIGFRHNGRANVVFLDGHVESLTPEGIDALQPLGSNRRYY